MADVTDGHTLDASDLPMGHFQAVVSSSDDAILSKDRDGIITSWNPAAERIYGYTPEEAIGQPISILIPPHRAGEERQILDQILAGQRVDHYETERLTKDGRLIVVSLSISPVRDESGEIVKASVIARDITARNFTLGLASRLQELTATLSMEIDRDRTIKALLAEVEGALGGVAGAVGLLDDSGETIELAGSVGYEDDRLDRWQRFPLASETPMSNAIRNIEAIWINDPGEMQRRFPDLGGHGRLKFGSLCVLPLAAGSEPFGAISLGFSERRSFNLEERAFLRAAAQQAANALERARLYHAEKESKKRLAFLARASEILAGSLDPRETLGDLADLAVDRMSDWCSVDLVGGDGEIHSVAVAHADPKRRRLAAELRERYPVDPDDPTGVPQVLRSGEPLLYPEISDELLAAVARDEDHLRHIRELGLRSAMIVPLKARGRVQGTITFVAAESGRRFGQSEFELAQDLARRAALAVDNAMAYQREHDAALELQRSLLQHSIPEVPGLEIAVHYAPAGAGLAVGGDWYEVASFGEGRAALTIGDVAGRGLRAAGIMGRARSALGAYVLDGHRPAEAVRRLDRLLRDSQDVSMLTLFHVELDPRSGRAQYVRAGHPPALLRHRDGDVVELRGGGTPPLGVLDSIEYRAHDFDLPPESTLLLYTDGLIERRGADLGDSIARLKAAFASAPADPEGCLRHLDAEFSATEVPDDVAMLALRRL